MLAGQRELGEILVGQDNVLLFGVLEALHEFAEFNSALAGGAPTLLLQAAAALSMELPERDVLVLRGAEQLDGDANHPKADGALPDRSWHVWPPPLRNEARNSSLPSPYSRRGCECWIAHYGKLINDLTLLRAEMGGI